MSMFKPGDRVTLVMDRFESNRGEVGTVTISDGAVCKVKWDNEGTKVIPSIVFDYMLIPIRDTDGKSLARSRRDVQPRLRIVDAGTRVATLEDRRRVSGKS